MDVLGTEVLLALVELVSRIPVVKTLVPLLLHFLVGVREVACVGWREVREVWGGRWDVGMRHIIRGTKEQESCEVSFKMVSSHIYSQTLPGGVSVQTQARLRPRQAAEACC